MSSVDDDYGKWRSRGPVGGFDGDGGRGLFPKIPGLSFYDVRVNI